MSFFISDAYAAAGAPQGDSPWSMLIIFVVLFGGMWLLMIRPQQKRQKEHQQMLSALNKGDEVVVAGGVLGRVKDVAEQWVTVEIAQGVEIKVQKQAVGAVMPKGTIKNL